MPTDPDPLTEAVDALRALGHTVEPCGDDLALWRVDKSRVVGDAELLALAAGLGLTETSARTQ